MQEQLIFTIGQWISRNPHANYKEIDLALVAIAPYVNLYNKNPNILYMYKRLAAENNRNKHASFDSNNATLLLIPQLQKDYNNLVTNFDKSNQRR